jgi:outer membrane protein assembly factor BamD (BamD/ComL family)
MKIHAAFFSVLLVLIAAFLFASCASGPVQIPDDTPPAKIIQRAQEALDTNKYKVAIQYYEALRERYGDSGEYLCTAEYEIAFIHYKQKRYLEARQEFESLLDRYNGVDAEFLPPSFKILAEKVLATIGERGF